MLLVDYALTKPCDTLTEKNVHSLKNCGSIELQISTAKSRCLVLKLWKEILNEK